MTASRKRSKALRAQDLASWPARPSQSGRRRESRRLLGRGHRRLARQLPGEIADDPEVHLEARRLGGVVEPLGGRHASLGQHPAAALPLVLEPAPLRVVPLPRSAVHADGGRRPPPAERADSLVLREVRAPAWQAAVEVVHLPRAGTGGAGGRARRGPDAKRRASERRDRNSSPSSAPAPAGTSGAWPSSASSWLRTTPPLLNPSASSGGGAGGPLPAASPEASPAAAASGAWARASARAAAIALCSWAEAVRSRPSYPAVGSPDAVVPLSRLPKMANGVSGAIVGSSTYTAASASAPPARSRRR